MKSHRKPDPYHMLTQQDELACKVQQYRDTRNDIGAEVLNKRCNSSATINGNSINKQDTYRWYTLLSLSGQIDDVSRGGRIHSPQDAFMSSRVSGLYCRKYRTPSVRVVSTMMLFHGLINTYYGMKRL